MQSDNIQKHPSFGMIGISHVQSTGSRLVGSEFNHQHIVTLSIRRAEKHWSLSEERWLAKEELIEVNLSEAQYVELMARPNMGFGVPCTLSQVAGERMPDPPEPESLREKLRDDFQTDAKKCADQLRETMELINNMLAGKQSPSKAALKQAKEKLENAHMQISSNIPFIQKQFDEHMENTVHHAAAEIEATVTNMAIRLGIEKMQQLASESPKLIEASIEPETGNISLLCKSGQHEDCEEVVVVGVMD